MIEVGLLPLTFAGFLCAFLGALCAIICAGLYLKRAIEKDEEFYNE